MAVPSLNARIIPQSTSAINATNWNIVFDFFDGSGTYSGLDVLIGDVIYIDTSVAVTGSLSKYRITFINSKTPFSVNCNIAWADSDVGNPQDPAFGVGIDQVILRVTSQGYDQVPSPGLQALPDRYAVFPQNFSFQKVNSDITGISFSNIGATGIAGLRGATGSSGVTGISGATGPAGAPQGVTGSQGTQGVTGVLGPLGVTGSFGLQGPIGQSVTGIQGSTGIGFSGVTGSFGLQGPVGQTVTGIQGSTGIGSQGVTGSFGLQGPVGLGATGFQGFTGASVQGLTGSFGIQGPQGATGVDATVAVAARYNTTNFSNPVSPSTVVVKFTTSSFDTNSAYNVATGEYTVPSTGKYHFDIFLDGSGSGSLSLNIKNNGSIIRSTRSSAVAAARSFSDILNLIAGDVLTVEAVITTNTVTFSNDSLNYFAIGKH